MCTHIATDARHAWKPAAKSPDIGLRELAARLDARFDRMESLLARATTNCPQCCLAGETCRLLRKEIKTSRAEMHRMLTEQMRQ